MLEVQPCRRAPSRSSSNEVGLGKLRAERVGPGWLEPVVARRARSGAREQWLRR